jgi:hypothetical protein
MEVQLRSPIRLRGIVINISSSTASLFQALYPGNKHVEILRCFQIMKLRGAWTSLAFTRRHVLNTPYSCSRMFAVCVVYQRQSLQTNSMTALQIGTRPLPYRALSSLLEYVYAYSESY